MKITDRIPRPTLCELLLCKGVRWNLDEIDDCPNTWTIFGVVKDREFDASVIVQFTRTRNSYNFVVAYKDKPDETKTFGATNLDKIQDAWSKTMQHICSDHKIEPIC